MDYAKTINLLQSRIPGKPETKPTQAEDKIAENETLEAVTEEQQRTGEEFSTFLTLLTAQIENQDPLAPLDSTQFVEQLATFSNLELQASGNQSLELIAALLVRQIELLTPTQTLETPSNTTIEATV